MPQYKVKINGSTYKIKDGFVISDELTETLDSGTIQFATTENVDVESFDDVEIKDYDASPIMTAKKQLIDSGYDDTIAFTPSEDHEYVFNTFSKTKDLERITLPNLSTTKTSENLKVYDFIQRYCSIYVPMIRVGTSSSSYNWRAKYTIASRVQAKFNTIVCPEMQWNTPTLREVLTDLMSTAKCIPIINQSNEIDYLDLSLSSISGRSEIDFTKLNLVRKSISSQDYCSDLTINLKNSISKAKNRIVEYTGFRTNNAGELTTDNMMVITSKPIYNIISCKLVHMYQISAENVPLREIDITNYIKENDEWNTYKIAASFSTILSDTNKNYKAINVHYKRGSNLIEGFGTTYKMRVGTSITGTTYPIVTWMAMKIANSESYPWGNLSGWDIREEVFFKLEYESVDEQALHIGRYLPIRHNENRIFDNQSNSYVDTQQQTIFEYIKVNRLSSAIRLIYGVYQNENQLPKLGDYKDDYILYSRKMEFYDGEIKFEGQMVKNNVIKDYFTGVQAKKRSWAIAEGSEALTRNDIYKFYVEASFYQKNETLTIIQDGINRGQLIGKPRDYLSSLLTNFEDEIIKWNIIITQKSTNIVPDAGYGYAIGINGNAAGKSIFFNSNFNDNYSAGDYITRDGGYGSTMLCQQYSYSYELGEFDKIFLYYVSTIDPADGEFTIPSIGENVYSVKSQLMQKGKIKPLIKTHYFDGTTLRPLYDYEVTLSSYVYKDQREITAQTLQLEYCSDTEDIVITDEFVKRNKYVAETFRTQYEPIQYTIEGYLYSLSTIPSGGNLPQASALYVNKIYVKESDHNYYKCESSVVSYDYELYTLNIVSVPSSAPHASAGKYRICKTTSTPSYTTLISTTIYGSYTDLPTQTTNNKYAIVSGGLLYKTIFNSEEHIREWARQRNINNGEYFQVDSTYYQWNGSGLVSVGGSLPTITTYGLYQSDGTEWSLQSHTPTTTDVFLYNNKYYTWNGADDFNEYGQSYSWVNKGTAIDKYFYYTDSVRKVYKYKYDGSLYYIFKEQPKQQPVRNAYIKSSLKVYMSNDKVRLYDMDYLPSNKVEVASANWSYSILALQNNTSAKLTLNITNNESSNYSTFYLTDTNNRVLLAVNRTLVKSQTNVINIYFNILRSRDTNIYNSSGEVVDDIIDN